MATEKKNALHPEEAEDMNRLRPILPMETGPRCGSIAGTTGEPMMLPVRDLRIDVTFQRSISSASAKNIEQICARFDWSKFLPVIVVREGRVFSVVDGQHRTTAAATLGIEEVPCYILNCSRGEAAAAFAAINGNVTSVSPVDIWFAEIMAGEPGAVRLNRVLESADVRITRKKNGHAPGETRAINVLKRAHKVYGEALLTTALQCITQTGNGNPGMISGAVLNGVLKSLVSKPDLLENPSDLFDIFDDIDLTEILESARVESTRTGNILQAIMTREVNAAITRSGKRG